MVRPQHCRWSMSSNHCLCPRINIRAEQCTVSPNSPTMTDALCIIHKWNAKLCLRACIKFSCVSGYLGCASILWTKAVLWQHPSVKLLSMQQSCLSGVKWCLSVKDAMRSAWSTSFLYWLILVVTEILCVEPSLTSLFWKTAYVLSPWQMFSLYVYSCCRLIAIGSFGMFHSAQRWREGHSGLKSHTCNPKDKGNTANSCEVFHSVYCSLGGNAAQT